MSVIEKIKLKVKSRSISTKVTLGYSLCFILLLAVLNAAMYFGVNYMLYSPAEKTILYSMEQVKNILNRLEENYDEFNSGSFQGALVAGVVLRVADANGEVFLDSDSSYPSIELFNQGILLDPPIFAASDFEISQIGSALIYRKQIDYSYDGSTVTLYFFRTITSEWTTLNNLKMILLVIELVGILLALSAGYWTIRNILKPIKNINELAREIAFENMEGRIPLGKTNDELNQLAKTFNDMLDRLKREIDSQKEFVANISHEFGQPATVFLNGVDLIRYGGMEDPKILQEATDLIEQEAKNLKQLLKNVSIISRSDRNCLAFKKKILDIDTIIYDIVRSARVYVHAHDLELVINEPAKIFGDEAAITQLIRVFLENAVKYTPDGGNIKIRSVISGEKVLVSISDSGIGIAPENQEHIFDRGFRVNKDSEIKGSGFGLAMAKIIADNHDIKISVDSELGKGTTFTLIIPLSRGELLR